MHPVISVALGACIGNASGPYLPGEEKALNIFVNTDPTRNGMRGLEVARIRSFFSFKFQNVSYPCALIRWYSHNDDGPDTDTGMWVVEPDSHPDGSAFTAVIHLDSILRAAHLIPEIGRAHV